MAEQQYLFEITEVVEALIKKQGINEGIWGISIEFGLGAINMKTGEGGKTLVPTAIAGVQKIGIRIYDEESNVTVDAAKVNPKAASSSKRAKSKSK